MILATRGWRGEDFQLVSPRFLAAVKHAIFAERLAPAITHDESTIATDLNALPVESRGQYGLQKMQAQKRLAHNRALLYPADDDG